MGPTILRGLTLHIKVKEIVSGHGWHHMDCSVANTIKKSLVEKPLADQRRGDY